MKFKEQKLAIKSGQNVTIRHAKEEDAQALVNLKRNYIKGTTTLPIYIDEYPDNAVKELNLIQEYYENSNNLLLVAEFNNQLIGNIDLTGGKRRKTQHTAMVGMGISSQWRNHGLGQILLSAAIDWTLDHSCLFILWLEVYATNELGINLYKKMGFELSGRINAFFKNDHDYIDKIQMHQYLEKKS